MPLRCLQAMQTLEKSLAPKHVLPAVSLAFAQTGALQDAFAVLLTGAPWLRLFGRVSVRTLMGN